MTYQQHDQLRNLFAGFRDRIDRERLDARKTGVVRDPHPREPHRFIVRRQAAKVIDLAARRVCRAHGLPDNGPERAA